MYNNYMYKSSILIYISLLIFSNILQAKETLRAISCECPPLTYSINGEIQGPAVDIFKNIQKKISANDTLSIYPWATGYIKLIEEHDVVLFATTRTKHRENKLKWVGPIAKKKFSFYANKGSLLKINSLEDVKKYRIGVVVGSNNEQFLISKGFKNIYSKTNEKDNLGNLLLGKIDLWYTDASQALALSKRISRNMLVIKELYKVKTNQSYFAFNKAIPDTTIKKWQNALDKMHKDGTILKIFQKYDLEFLYP